ncbi:restriction endonuclease subunit S [Streptococcus suis]|uniref:restriction endonuclease subunit S n=1 Tax=Streptococcus suis TaxID=1307 RepID=UPI001A99CDA4|nr:restriction endonuclease subunit S [Streptococcus suis]QTA56500.1 restriction endonuclease subunit S [Streptococcus suis]HEM5160161.1 restriction endonuclease subunit S [Streptococcus suis]HEM6334307.1 restriction endonuclease subunit S [Streptococcus suis]HEM6336574.1 restriction endonuclease subunit S [Streptococcus suis]HEM6369047.1 restriction endonuclease subunit S [Streptococcus suis]
MTKEKSTVPRLRFPGFTDAWKQRKLGEVAEKISQKNLDRQYVETFTNSAEFGIISQRDFFEKNISSLDNISGYYIVSPDDFVYNPRISNLAPVGPIKRNKLGRVGVMSPLYTIFRFSDIHLDFVEKYFDTTIWHRYMELNGDSGARSDRFAIKDSVFKGLPIPLPTLPEQEAIGSFFSDLDQLITLHQRKLDDVKELKKALLQKMFPKGNGNDFPELRFPEFTDAWKQRKLGEVSKRVTRRNKELISSLPLTISAQHGLVDQEEFFNKQVASKDVSSYYLIKKGEFAYNKSYSNGYPWGAIKRLDRYEMGVLSTLYIVFKPTSLICSDYLVSYYDTVNWYKEVSMIAAEGARNHGLLNIAPNDFFKTRLFIPTLPEQEAIGSFFSDLDQLITLHQRQLDHLKLLKKALLQQMFI